MKNLVLILCVLCWAAASAQSGDKAKEVLDKTFDVFTKSGDLSVSFTMNVRDVKNKVSESYDASIDLKGQKFHISAPDNEIWFDGKTQWSLQKSWEEVNITEPSAAELQSVNPTALLAIYKKDCKYKYLGQKTDDKKRKLHEIELKMQKKGDPISKIILQVNGADFLPVSFHVFFSNGIENTIHVSACRTQMKHPDSLFVFDNKKYPQAEIIDLR